MHPMIMTATHCQLALASALGTLQLEGLTTALPLAPPIPGWEDGHGQVAVLGQEGAAGFPA